MAIFMIVVFIVGYLCIALEHPLKIDKAASALLIGVLTWTIFILLGDSDIHHVGEQLNENLAETAQTLFFLFAAMTIVEIVDRHNGFKIITDRITATNKVKLLWIISFLTFFMSAVLDNLTTTIVILSLLRKLIKDQHTRWTYASIVVIAANAGGAWSPIGDVTTIMLWIGGQITAGKIITGIIIPSLVSMLVPLIILSFTLKGEIIRPAESKEAESITTPGEQMALLILGVGLLLFVPVFKTITHLPPYMGMLLGLGVMWMVTELMHKKKSNEIKKRLSVVNILKNVETPTIFFFLGILTAVGALGAAGQLSKLSEWLRDVTGGNIYIIDTMIGVLSSIIDNVPLVAASMKMYVIDPSVLDFAVDGTFWHMLAYCAGTGGSILIIGSAAGVAAMGLEKIDFIWYLKHISWLALVGYLAGAFCIYLEHIVLA
ncbi:MAG: sodium:proton antiporter NhaD [Paludibacteraceae bacterium]|nr:sodium:proton antiporter NhaD [Paludibacteraceae bacterium]MBR2624282.1 sodium:proton antiporter NhaD [Paludibacteraceae bacterium]